MAEINISKSFFQELVLENTKTVLLDFWAPWCGPCRMLAPILAEIAEEREDILVGKVNVDEEIELAMEFQVASIPTLVVVKNGKVTNKAIGYMPKDKVLALLD